MSTDGILLTIGQPSPADLYAGCLLAVERGLLRSFRIDGDWDDELLVGVVGKLPAVGRPDMVVSLSRPRNVTVRSRQQLAADLGFTLPADADARIWVSDFRMENPSDLEVANEVFVAVMTMIESVIAARVGYFVITSGGSPIIVEIDGSLRTEPVRKIAPAGPTAPGPAADNSTMFIGAFLSAPGDAAAQWHRVLQAARTLCIDMPSHEPDYILTDEEWGPLDGEPSVPDFWPLGQQLWASAGQFGWRVAGHVRPDGNGLVDLQGDGLRPDGRFPRFESGLAALAEAGLDYAYQHSWHPDEPWTGPVGPRLTGDGPYFLLSARDLAVGLPNLYWSQVLGPRWVERIGRDRIVSTPAHRVRELAGGRREIVLVENLDVVTKDYPRFAAARAGCVEHLGREHFPFLEFS